MTQSPDLTPAPLSTYRRSHHTGNTFTNDPGDPEVKFVFPTFRALFRIFSSPHDCPTPLPIVRPNFALPIGIRSYWIGHSTNLIQINDVFILTDPVFEDHASPIPGFVKRVTPAPCEISDLPPISVILISHDHWDHLESSALAKLTQHSPGVKIFAPLVVADLIQGWGFEAIPFDWRQHLLYKGIDFTCFPARHACSRYGIDLRERLWCSWLIEKSEMTVYFPGDTAIGPHFSEVREKVGRPIDLVTMPIGPQEPNATMRAVHTGPGDAYDMSVVLEARVVYPIHYGTFPLGRQTMEDDRVALRNAWHGDNLRILDPGEYVEWKGTEFRSLTDGAN